MSNISIRKFITNYDNGEYKCDTYNPSRLYSTMIRAGWYDWFCSDGHLYTALKGFAPKIKALSKSPKVNIDTMYVFFKNNCPMVGPTYDDFRICDLESGDVQYCISNVKKGCYGEDFSGWEVYGVDNDFDAPLVRGSWKDVKTFFAI